MWAYQSFCRNLSRLGISAVEMVLPYHGRRNRPGGIIADYFLSPDIGKTIRTVRQAVLDTKRVVDWLYQENYENVGLLGVSLGSCVAGLAAAHHLRIRKSALILTAGDFAEVVWTGRATRHVKRAIEVHATLKQIQDVWSIISTEPFAAQLARRDHRCLIISGKRDQVVKPCLTSRFIERLREEKALFAWRRLGCGHYSLGMFPFNVVTFLMVAGFFRSGHSW